jgi:hypothetical protein
MRKGGQKVIGISGRPIIPLKRFIKTLKPWQVEAVMMSLQGIHTDIIAEKFDTTSQTIGNLLRTTQALEIRDKVNARVMAQAMQEIPDTVKQIQVAALANMQRVLTDEKLQKASPMALFDKSAKALEVMSRINPATLGEVQQTQSQSNTQVNNIFAIIEKEEQQTLHEKIIQSLDVAEVHSWISGESIDGTGTVTSASRQLPSSAESGSDTEGVWAGRSSPTPAKNQSEDGPVLSLDLGASVQRSESESARKSVHMDAPNKDSSV